MRKTLWIWWLLLLAFPQNVWSQECGPDQIVASVKFVGCNKGRCSDGKVQQRLASLTDMVGLPFDQARLALAGTRLQKTGYFRSVTPRCRSVSPSTAVVSFKVVPNRYVRKVRIEGLRTMYRSEVEKRLFLRMGALFNPDDKDSQDRLQRQAATIETWMKQQGLETGKVVTGTQLVEPDLVDITLRLEEGAVARIERIKVQVEQPEAVKDHPEFSCPRLSERDLSSVTGVERGDLFTGSTPRTVKKEIRYLLQEYGFQSPKVKVEFDQETRIMLVKVKVTTCFAIHLFEREDEEPYGHGYEKVQEPDLYKVLPFRESGAFDLREAQRGVDELLLHYRLRGYLFARVEMQHVNYRELFPPWPHPLVGGVNYRITRGQPSEIREIRFEGVKSVKASELADLMKTRRYDFFDVGGFLEVEQLFGDLNSIRSYYKEHGYFRMAYPDARGEDVIRVDRRRFADRTLWRFTYRDMAFDVARPDWENAITVVIRVDEGEGSRIREVRFQGITDASPPDLLKDLPLRAGVAFARPMVERMVNEMNLRYRRRGFTPTITVSCTGQEPDVPREECSPTSLTSLSVSLTFHVQEGIQQRMGEVLVVGNLKTNSRVIARDFPADGELYNQARVDEAVRRLRNSGVFSSVKVFTIGQDETPPRERVAVVVHVEETTTKFLEFSAGFQTIARPEERINMHPLARDGLSATIHMTSASLTGSASSQPINLPDVLLLGEVSYYDKNFLGMAKTLMLPVQYGLSTTDPARYASFTPTYFDRRFLLNDLTMRFTPLVVYDRALKLLDTFEYGAENEFSYTLFNGIYMSLLTRVTYISWKNPSDDHFGDMEFQVKTTPQIRFDWRDNPINPMSGSLIFGRLSYINALNEAAARDNFWKYEVGAQLYLSFRRTVVLATNVRFGDSLSENGGDLPENERFRLGGSNGMRGYAYGAVAQYDRDGSLRLVPATQDGVDGWVPVVGGNSVLHGSLEIRFPISARSGLWGAVFTDFGALADQVSDFNGNSFRFSVGGGIRWLIGGQIPLRLDYGVVVDRRCAEVDFASGQCTAREEPGALDFGLLYTF